MTQLVNPKDTRILQVIVQQSESKTDILSYNFIPEYIETMLSLSKIIFGDQKFISAP